MEIFRRIVAFALLGLSSACNLESPTERGQIPEELPTKYVVKGPEGLEQTVWIEPPAGGPDDVKYLTVDSEVVNKGTRTITVITRTCMIFPTDIEGEQVVLVPINPPDCSQRSADTLDLDPGQGTETVTSRFRVDGIGPGRHTLLLRQILRPGFVAAFDFRI